MNASSAIASGYGAWEAANPDCAAFFNVSPGIQTLQLCWCIINTCQALFLLTRWPRIGWELVMAPAIQSVVYGLGYSGFGYLRTDSGQVFAFGRFFMCVTITPVLLMDVNKMSTVRFFGINMNSLQIACNILMWVLWLTSTLSADPGVKWMFFVLGLLCLIFILGVSLEVFASARTNYMNKHTDAGDWVAQRITLMMVIFFPTWVTYCVLYVISGEGACVANENVVIVLAVILDLFQKNVFGILVWTVYWTFLQGSWNPDTLGDVPVPDRTQGMKDPEAQMPGDMPPTRGNTIYADSSHISADMFVNAPKRQIPSIPTHFTTPSHRTGHSSVPQTHFSERRIVQKQNVGEMRPPFGESGGEPRRSLGDGPVADHRRSFGEPYRGGDVEMSPIQGDWHRGFAGYTAEGLATAQPHYERRVHTRSRDASPIAGLTPAAAQLRTRSRLQDTSMDEVVDHVRSLNQALSDLLVGGEVEQMSARRQPMHAAADYGSASPSLAPVSGLQRRAPSPPTDGIDPTLPAYLRYPAGSDRY